MGSQYQGSKNPSYSRRYYSRCFSIGTGEQGACLSSDEGAGSRITDERAVSTKEARVRVTREDILSGVFYRNREQLQRSHRASVYPLTKGRPPRGSTSLADML
ncbi:hypothetical protein CEXT_526291 [Caerostris extrusa]|uniref:Uncharacterized protein n=1 Tax=Caerostris extrusa TaxID=172846 RepID=A0AAV4WHU4_CAEEX|nr:hypothetical protein CEXT_526291 [Caerostris extrusa]